MVLSIFYTKHRKASGNKAVFKKAIHDLNELCKKGLTFKISETETHTIYFRVLLALSDNLGINQISGYSRGFNVKFYCRFCKADLKECQCMCRENDELLRTKLNYEDDIKKKIQMLPEFMKNVCSMSYWIFISELIKV